MRIRLGDWRDSGVWSGPSSVRRAFVYVMYNGGMRGTHTERERRRRGVSRKKKEGRKEGLWNQETERRGGEERRTKVPLCSAATASYQCSFSPPQNAGMGGSREGEAVGSSALFLDKIEEVPPFFASL